MSFGTIHFLPHFNTFLVDFIFYFKHVIFFHLDELLDLSSMVGKYEMSSFWIILNSSKILHVASDTSQTVHEGLVGRFNKIYLVTLIL
jgi:hypothetical protein